MTGGLFPIPLTSDIGLILFNSPILYQNNEVMKAQNPVVTLDTEICAISCGLLPCHLCFIAEGETRCLSYTRCLPYCTGNVGVIVGGT
jgi:hypothetical protein